MVEFKAVALVFSVLIRASTALEDLNRQDCLLWPFNWHESGNQFYLNQKFRQSGYDRKMVPVQNQSEDLNVSFGLIVTELQSLNDIVNELTMTIGFRMTWTDPRIQISQDCLELLNMTDTRNCSEFKPIYLSVNDLEESLWHPRLSIMNLKEVDDLDFLFKTKEAIVNGCTGEVTINSEIKISISCLLNLQWFPFDIQWCQLLFHALEHGNNGIPVKHFIDLQWNPEPVVLHVLHSLTIDGSNWDKSFFYGIPKEGKVRDLPPFCRAYFRFSRFYVSYLVKTFIPSTLLVLASFGSFFIPSHQIPGRMTLTITTTLTLIAMTNSVFENAPKTAYLKAMDIWMISCFTFTFLSLAEFCMVIYLNGLKESTRHSGRVSFKVNGQQVRMKNLHGSCKAMGPALATLLERCSRILLPLGFIIFILLFFVFAFENRDKNAPIPQGIRLEPMKTFP